jgi:hypothetical protein
LLKTGPTIPAVSMILSRHFCQNPIVISGNMPANGRFSAVDSAMDSGRHSR